MPTSVLIKPNITNSEMEFTTDVDFASVELNATMTLAQLIGWVDATQSTKLVRVDSDGNLLVSTEGTASNTLAVSSSSVTTSVTLIVTARSNRRELLITNAGSETVYIGYDDTVTLANGFPLIVGAYLNLDNYIGAVYGISPTTTNDVRVLEQV